MKKGHVGWVWEWKREENKRDKKAGEENTRARESRTTKKGRKRSKNNKGLVKFPGETRTRMCKDPRTKEIQDNIRNVIIMTKARDN